MDRELEVLLERARATEITEAQRTEQIITLAAANGSLSNERVTAEAIIATQTIKKAAASESECD